MDRNRPYSGHGSSARRRHSSGMASDDSRTAKRSVKLIICIVIFIAAAFMKLVFPGTLQTVGDKLNAAVNYKAALATLGEGISGKKKFVTALGEAFTYAFTGASEPENNAANTPGTAQSSPGVPSPQKASGDAVASPSTAGSAVNNKAKAAGGASDSSAGEDSAANTSPGETVAAFSQSDVAAASPSSNLPAEKESSGGKSGSEAGVQESDKTFSDAVIAAFLQDQEQYSDYAIPAGVSYGKPKISIDYTTPLKGVVTSSFGYRIHPVDKTVKFHYGTDIAADKGTAIVAFADGKVISAGVSTTLGNYVLISHGGVQTQYAHCGNVLVKAGQAVKKGDKIATVGDTGNATETCLHFELRVSGVSVNPEFYIQWS